MSLEERLFATKIGNMTDEGSTFNEILYPDNETKEFRCDVCYHYSNEMCESGEIGGFDGEELSVRIYDHHAYERPDNDWESIVIKCKDNTLIYTEYKMNTEYYELDRSTTYCFDFNNADGYSLGCLMEQSAEVVHDEGCTVRELIVGMPAKSVRRIWFISLI